MSEQIPTALHNFVLVDVDTPEEEQVTDSGIYLGAQKKERQSYGLVVSAGDDCKYCQKGMTVYFSNTGGWEQEVNGKKYMLFREDNIWGMK